VHPKKGKEKRDSEIIDPLDVAACRMPYGPDVEHALEHLWVRKKC